MLVPLCGKSKDLVWLAGLGLQVDGIELYEDAVKSFFKENELPVEVTRESKFTAYTCATIRIRCGDFFALEEPAAYDFVYDRGALVALPEAMRGAYAQVVARSLKKSGQGLIIAYEYEPSQMEGPPFAVSGDEIRRLYGGRFAVRLMEAKKPADEGPRLAAVPSLRQTVYAITAASA